MLQEKERRREKEAREQESRRGLESGVTGRRRRSELDARSAGQGAAGPRVAAATEVLSSAPRTEVTHDDA